MASYPKYDLTVREDRAKFMKEKVLSVLLAKGPIVKLTLSKLFADGGLAKDKCKNEVQRFRRECRSSIDSEDSLFSDLTTSQRIVLMAMTGIAMTDKIKKLVGAYVILEKNFIVKSRHPDFPFEIKKKERRNVKNEKEDEEEEKEDLQSHSRLAIGSEGIDGYKLVHYLREFGEISGVTGEFHSKISSILEGKTLGKIEPPDLQSHYDLIYSEIEFMIFKAAEVNQKKSVSQLVAGFNAFSEHIGAPKYALKTNDKKFVNEQLLESCLLHVVRRLALTSLK